MTLLARWLPGLWSLLWATAAAWLGLEQQGYAATVCVVLAARPLVRDLEGRFDRTWLALPLTLAALETLDAAFQRIPIGCRWTFVAAAAIVLAGSLRHVAARVRRTLPTDEPEDILLLALGAPAWPLLFLAGTMAASEAYAVVAVLLSPILGWLLSLRQPKAVKHRLARLGCWDGPASWSDPFPVWRWVLLPAWCLLWLMAPRRARRRGLLDAWVARSRAELQDDAGESLAAELPATVRQAASAFVDDPAVALEAHLLWQALALHRGRYEQAIAAGHALAGMIDAVGLTATRHRLVQQALGETSLAYARLERPVEAMAWLDRMGADPVLDTFLRPIVMVLCEPPELRTDEQWRPIANLPWAAQVPASAPLRRWQRVMHVEQLRQRLTAGYDPAAAAQGMAMGERPIRETPPDEVLVVARLQEAEGYPAMARATLSALLDLPDLPRNFRERARAELERLGEAT